MSEGSLKSAEEKELVQVLQDYSYKKDENTKVSMYKGEVFLLLKCDNKDWWQVIRRTARKPFYAPANNLRVMSEEEEKKYVEKEKQQDVQKSQQQPPSDEGILGKRDEGSLRTKDEGNVGKIDDGSLGKRDDGSLGKRPQGMAMAESEGRGGPSSPKGQAYMAKIEPTRVLTEKKEVYPGRQFGFSSFKGDGSKGSPIRSGSSEVPSSGSNLSSFHSGQESSSSHTSKSSLSDGSAESLKHHHFRKHVMKASSHDELMKGERSQSSLDVSQPRASSNEELDGHHNNRDYLFKSNQLSHRHRSNSVDFKLFQRDLSILTETNKGSLDKARKPRISKDPGNRRRSWAVEGSDSFRPSLRRGETVDAAIILDVPPKLPPKQKKNRMDAFKSSCENISKLEGPVDLKLQEVKSKHMHQQANTSLNTSLPLNKDEDRRHSRHASDPLLLSENERQSPRRDQWDVKDPPVALPRKFLPPQVSSLDGRKVSQETHAGMRNEVRKMSEEAHTGLRNEISFPVSYGDSFPRDTNGTHPVKKSSSHTSINTNANTVTVDEGLLRRGMSMSHGNRPKHENMDKTHGVFISLKKTDGTPESKRSVTSGTQTSPKTTQRTPETTKKTGFKTPFQSFKNKGAKKEVERKDEEKEAENKVAPHRETPTPDSSRGGKMMPTPPSPQLPPQRLVMEDWGEYLDEATGRPYYYNPRTREKRWKPPRKIMHSVSIPEVPSSAKEDDSPCNPHLGPPRSPVPDYPTSPKSSHKPFCYGRLPEGPPGILPSYPSSQTHPTLHPQPSLPPPSIPASHPHPSLSPPSIPTSHSHPSLPPTSIPTSHLHPSLPPPSFSTSHPHPSFPPPPIPTSAITSNSSTTHPTLCHTPLVSVLSSSTSSVQSHQSTSVHTLPSSTVPHLSSTSHPTASHTLPSSTSSSGKTVSVSRHAPPSQMLTQTPGIPPAVPPSSAKPTLPSTPTNTDCPDFSLIDRCHNSALVDLLYNMKLPRGWEKRYDAYTQRIYFCNKAVEGRWLATFNDEGKIYYYEESGVKSQWVLPQTLSDDTDDPDSRCDSTNRPTSPKDNVRISQIAEHLPELVDYVIREGFVHRTFLLREGKKVRKNWVNSYVRFIQREFDTGSTGILYFSKSRDEDKKAEIFEFYPPCYLEHASDKKTSKQQVLGIRNARETEVLLQFDDWEIEQEWLKILYSHDGVEYVQAEKEEKKGKRGSDKLKRETSMEQLNTDSKGITDKLRQFIKRRPMKETLEKKGIYKESVFGSTLAELHIQDKTAIPIFVLQCINHIEKSEQNLTTDGLYRISGNAAQIQKIRYEVGQRNYTILSREKEIHNLSGALKLFFRELKEPLIPFENYQDFIQATGSEYRRKNQQAEKLTKAVNRLPVENYDTLKVLLQHLLRVSEYEKENRMSISNLAIVFGPCLLWPRDTNAHDLMTDVMLHNRVIEGLLTDYSRIFASWR